jgi:hypothetical protein
MQGRDQCFSQLAKRLAILVDQSAEDAVASGVRGGTVITSMPSEANTASKVAVNLESRRG